MEDLTHVLDQTTAHILNVYPLGSDHRLRCLMYIALGIPVVRGSTMASLSWQHRLDANGPASQQPATRQGSRTLAPPQFPSAASKQKGEGGGGGGGRAAEIASADREGRESAGLQAQSEAHECGMQRSR